MERCLACEADRSIKRVERGDWWDASRGIVRASAGRKAESQGIGQVPRDYWLGIIPRALRALLPRLMLVDTSPHSIRRGCLSFRILVTASPFSSRSLRIASCFFCVFCSFCGYSGFHQSPITNHQSPITFHLSLFTFHLSPPWNVTRLIRCSPKTGAPLSAIRRSRAKVIALSGGLPLDTRWTGSIS
jgi:hypothetical protein